MNALTYSHARQNFVKTMEQVCNNHDPVIITRRKQSPVVMISLEDYEAMEETSYLLKSPENVRRLMKSVDEFKSGKGKVRKLLS